MLDRTVYWLFRLSILVTRPLPLRLGYRVGEYVALACYWLIFHRQRRALNANLAHVLQSNDARFVDSVARRSFRNFGKYVIDFVHYPVMTRDEVRSRLRFDQFDELRAAEATGRGVIIATIHFGTWDLGAAAMAAHDFPVYAVAERFAYGPMNDLVQGSRAKLGMKVLAGDRLGPGVFKALRRGEMLAMLIDVSANDASAVEVQFFGAPARVSSMPARIALRTGAWIMPGIVIRDPGDEMVIHPIIDTSLGDFPRTGDEQADARALTQQIIWSLEPLIRAHLDQWFIFHKLWKQPVPTKEAA